MADRTARAAGVARQAQLLVWRGRARRRGGTLLASSPTRISMRHRIDDTEPRDTIPCERSSTTRPRSHSVYPTGTSSRARSASTPSTPGTTTAPPWCGRSRSDRGCDRGGRGRAWRSPRARTRAREWTPPSTRRVRSTCVRSWSTRRELKAAAASRRPPSRSCSRARPSSGCDSARASSAARCERRADGGLSVEVDAVRLDLRALLAEEPAGATTAKDAATSTAIPAASPVAPFDFEASAGAMLLLHEVETQRFEGAGSWNGERWDRLSFHGAFDDANRVAFDYDRSALPAASTSRRTTSGGSCERSPRRRRSRAARYALLVPAPCGEGISGHADLRIVHT